MTGLKISSTVILSILATGAILNMASSGLFGATIQQGANYITKGYGV